jgi:hypothetical protein
MDLFLLDEETTDKTKRILNAQISEATGMELGNYSQSVKDALTLVPSEWHWEPLWQSMLRQLREPNPDHPDKMVGGTRQMPDGSSSEILVPLPIAISMAALEVHRSMSRRRETVSHHASEQLDPRDHEPGTPGDDNEKRS